MAGIQTDSKEPLVAVVLAYVKAHFLLVTCSLIILRALYKRYVSPIRDIPGPFLASCSRLWKGRRWSA